MGLLDIKDGIAFFDSKITIKYIPLSWIVKKKGSV